MSEPRPHAGGCEIEHFRPLFSVDARLQRASSLIWARRVWTSVWMAMSNSSSGREGLIHCSRQDWVGDEFIVDYGCYVVMVGIYTASSHAWKGRRRCSAQRWLHRLQGPNPRTLGCWHSGKVQGENLSIIEVVVMYQRWSGLSKHVCCSYAASLVLVTWTLSLSSLFSIFNSSTKYTMVYVYFWI